MAQWWSSVGSDPQDREARQQWQKRQKCRSEWVRADVAALSLQEKLCLIQWHTALTSVCVRGWKCDGMTSDPEVTHTHTHTDCTHSGVFVLDASHPVTFLEDATWRHFILTKDQCVLSAVNPKPHSDIINLGVWMDVTDVLWAQVWSDLGVYFLPDDAIEDPQHELTWIWEP